MFECMIMGDSIAVGSHSHRPRCELVARTGLSSRSWWQRYNQHSLKAHTVIVSLGSNDTDSVSSYRQLLQIREKITAHTVYWIAPNASSRGPQLADVEAVARQFGDSVIRTDKYSADRIHPTHSGYRELMNQTLKPSQGASLCTNTNSG